MSSFNISATTMPAVSRPNRPYQLIPLYWEAHRGLHGEGEGVLATRKQLQDAIVQFARHPQGATCLGLAPGVVVQLSDGLYWLSQDWQVLCL